MELQASKMVDEFRVTASSASMILLLCVHGKAMT